MQKMLTVTSPGDMDRTQIEPNLYLASVFTGMNFTLKVVGHGSYSDFFIFLQFLSLIKINIVEIVIVIFLQIIRESLFSKSQG